MEKLLKEKLAKATIALEKMYGSAKNKNIHTASKKEIDRIAKSMR